MAASEIRRAIVGNIPECLRNCVNKEYFLRAPTGGATGYPEGKFIFLLFICKFIFNFLFFFCCCLAGINGGYYSGGLQQAHSTTPHEAPHSVAHAPPSGPPPPTTAPQQPVSAVREIAPPPQGVAHGLVSKSVSNRSILIYFFI